MATYDIRKVEPFRKVVVDTTVDWDFDDGDEPPESAVSATLSPEELESPPFECLDRRDGCDWRLDMEKFENGLSEYLTLRSGFCHNGFSYDCRFTYNRHRQGLKGEPK